MSLIRINKHLLCRLYLPALRLVSRVLKSSLVLLVSMGLAATVQAQSISVDTVPDNGLQPRLINGEDNSLHLLYFKKRINRRDAREGNLYYRQYDKEKLGFGLPVKVSSEAFPLQTVSISRASFAIDGAGRVHVLWYQPKLNQYFYTRSNIDRTQFESQREVVQDYSLGLDASGDIAANGDDIAITWGAGDLSREYERTVFAEFSSDGGETFSQEVQLGNPDLGACACCSLATDFIADGDLLVAYRSAIAGVGRHMQFLTVQGLENPERAFYKETSELQQWEASFCPLSTNDILVSDVGSWAVFETESRIIQLNLEQDAEPTAVGEPFSETRQKNPSIALNDNKERLIVWAEAISHSRGGRLNMRLFNQSGQSLETGFIDEINLSDFTFPAAGLLPTGGFIVLY